MLVLNKITAYLLAIPFIFFITGCGDKFGHGDNRLTIANNSDSSIFVVLQYNYPDTFINEEAWTYKAYNYATVEAHTTVKIWNSHNWEDVIQQNNPLQTMMVFIFSSTTVQNTPWEQIRANYTILKRYDLTINELKARNWVVVYP